MATRTRTSRGRGLRSYATPSGGLSGVPSALRSFLSTEAGGAGLLAVAALAALVWANWPGSQTYAHLWETPTLIEIGSWRLDLNLHEWINDGLMVVFFLVVGMEVRRELSMGELTDRRRIVVPLVAALLGIVVPAAIYLALNPSGPAAAGWGVVIGTDTAFMLGAVALLGPACPAQLRIFLLTLTVFDDIVAVSVIGVAYSDEANVPALVVMALALLALCVLGRLGVWRTWPYALVIVVLWLATLESGLHPSIAGMVAGLLVPAYAPGREAVDRATTAFRSFRQSPLADVGYHAKLGLQRAVSVNERLQVVLHPWTSYVIVPLFAFANAGVDLRGGVLQEALRSSVTWGVVAGLVIGKFLGIGLGAIGAVRLRLGQLPQGVSPSQVMGGAAMSGIGFTVSLLIIGLAFDDAALRSQATVGVLLAAVGATLLGGLVFWVSRSVFGHRYASLPTVLDRPVDPERDHVRGNPDAPLTLVEYGDFECPFCGKATGMLREVREQLGDRLRYVFRHLPLTDVHPHAEEAAVAAEAAARQGKFWEFHDVLFENQDELEFEDLLGHADRAGLDVERFARDLSDPELLERVRADADSAEASGARGTPTFFVGDQRHIGAYDARTLIAELESGELRAADEETEDAGRD